MFYDKDIERTLDKIELTLKILIDIRFAVETLNDNITDRLQKIGHEIYSSTANLNQLNLTLIKSESISQPAGV